MRRLIVVAAYVLTGAGMIACRHALDLTQPAVIEQQLRGTWSDTVSYPGISTIFTVAVSDTTLSGTGTFTIEAGPSGTLTVTGVIAGSTVSLDLTRSDGYVEHFRGALAADDLLSGIVWYTGPLIGDPVGRAFRRIAR